MLSKEDAVWSEVLNVAAFVDKDPLRLAATIGIWLNEQNNPIHQITFLQDAGNTLAMVVYRGAVR